MEGQVSRLFCVFVELSGGPTRHHVRVPHGLNLYNHTFVAAEKAEKKHGYYLNARCAERMIEFDLIV